MQASRFFEVVSAYQPLRKKVDYGVDNDISWITLAELSCGNEPLFCGLTIHEHYPRFGLFGLFGHLWLHR